jgi:hypothetical protein
MSGTAIETRYEVVIDTSRFPTRWFPDSLKPSSRVSHVRQVASSISISIQRVQRFYGRQQSGSFVVLPTGAWHETIHLHDLGIREQPNDIQMIQGGRRGVFGKPTRV